MKKGAQLALHCPCGSLEILALGLCATCYSLKRQDEENFGGLREQVLERDGYRCRVCAELPEIDRICANDPPGVHHRVPGVSKLHLMITLGPAHHAQVHRLLVADKPMSPLCLKLWREQHPNGHEQIMLDFTEQQQQAEVVPLFYDTEEEG